MSPDKEFCVRKNPCPSEEEGCDAAVVQPSQARVRSSETYTLHMVDGLAFHVYGTKSPPEFFYQTAVRGPCRPSGKEVIPAIRALL